MGLSINGGASGVVQSGGPQDQINRILNQIKVVRKQLTALQKQIQETGDPDVRKLLIKQVDQLQRTIEMLQQQIAMIEANEQRKEEMRAHAQRVEAAEQQARPLASKSS